MWRQSTASAPLGVRYVSVNSHLNCTLGSAVQREVYGTRVAEAAKISTDAMKLEIERAYKRRVRNAKKQQEKMDLAPEQKLRPEYRSIRYENMNSAMAEESVIAQILQEPALLNEAKPLKSDMFSSPLLGSVYSQLSRRYEDGMDVSVAVLEDFSAEEMSHITHLLQRRQGPVSQSAFADCVRTIQAEYQAAHVTSEDDLLAFQNQLKQRKGINT